MKNMYKFIAENLGQGNIKKQTAIEMLQMLKTEEVRSEDIAITGISIRLPFASDLDEFWNNVQAGVDCIGPVPEHRKNDIDRYLKYIGIPEEKIQYFQAAFLDQIDQFDYDFFRLSPKEASLMDPHQRLFLETVWHCIEDAGYGQSITGTNTGVFTGFVNGFYNYGKMVAEVEPASLSIALPGNFTALLPSRISYLYDLKGPSLVIDTACSSSLVAVDAAIQAIRAKHCDQAIASGVRLQIVPFIDENMSIGLESSDGKTRAFDDSSDGAGIGEGIAAVFLKPLSKAIKDKDRIYAVIKGSAVNQDGNSVGITAPNPAAQADVIAKAWENADIDPETIAYIQTHGTGTSLGDPIEIKGIQNAFRRYTNKKQFCAVSSVKTQLGHLYESAGIVNLITAVLAMQHQEMPPSLHFQKPNREIPFVDSPVYVNTQKRKWEKQAGVPRRCGVSSFGMSGTNVHVILEEAPEPASTQAVETPMNVLTLSARTEHSLQELVASYQQLLTKADELSAPDLCFTANTARGHYAHRLLFQFDELGELQSQLAAVANRADFDALDVPHVYYGRHKLVAGNKKVKDSGDITDGRKRELSNEASPILQAFLASGRSDQGQLQALAQLYVQGADIAWDTLYQKEAHRKVGLPLYPFEPRRCWLHVPEVATKQASNLQDMFYAINWNPEPFTGKTTCPATGAVLVFQDQRGLSDHIVAQLQVRGNHVIQVRHGAGFDQVGENTYVVGNTEADYDKLLAALSEQQLSQIVHLLQVTDQGEVRSTDDLQKSHQLGFESLFALTRALAKTNLKEEIDVVLVGENIYDITGNERSLRPEQAPLFGLARVVRVEHPKLNCRCVDIDELTDPETLLRELDYGKGPLMVAYRDGVRYTSEFGNADLNRVEDKVLDIRSEGIYLITGGTGGMGLEMAKWLAVKNKVNLALVNRTPLPPRDQWDHLLQTSTDRKLLRKIKEIRDLEASGARVVVRHADIASFDDMKGIVDQLHAEFGRINGVLHTAGIPGSGYVIQKNAEQMAEVFAPKLAGTWNLHHLTLGDNPDFFVMMSSGAAMVGEPGQGDYAAANAYLDAIAMYRRQLGQSALSINWTSWKEVGMAVEYGDDLDRIFIALTTARALQLFDTLLNKDVSRVMVGELDLQYEGIMGFIEQSPYRISERLLAGIERGKQNREESYKQVAAGDANVTLSGKENDSDYTATERTIAAVWQEVLGFDKFHIEDNFYELGGDSVLALRIANILNTRLSLHLQATDLMQHLTIQELGQFIEEDHAQEAGDSTYPSIVPIEKREYYPLSSAQRRLYILQELEGNGTAYNIAKAVLLEGEIDIERFNPILRQIIERHESLRTTIEVVDGEPMQRVHPHVDFSIDYLEPAEEDIPGLIQAFSKPFDLSQAPQLRFQVMKLADKKYLAQFDMHHIVTDGASMDVLVEEFAGLYRGETLAELKVQYRDYAAWQTELFESEAFQKHKHYWVDVYAEPIPTLQLPTDFPRPDVMDFQGGKTLFQADEALTARIHKLARSTGTTLYMVLLAAYNVLLAKYSGTEDIAVGSPAIGRPKEELESVIGMFVNTIAIRNRPVGTKTFQDFLQEVRTNSLKAFDHQDYPFEQLVQDLGIRRDSSRNPIFDTMFALQNVGVRGLEIDGVSFSMYDFDTGVTRFDLYLETAERDGEIHFALEYRTSLFNEETVRRLALDYLSVLEAVVENAEQTLAEIVLQSSKHLLPALGLDEEEDEIEFNF